VAPLKCPECGQDAVLRYQCLSPLEHLLSVLQICPFRCQICSHRFLAFSLGRSYPTHVLDRREHVRMPVQLQLAFSGGRIRGEGQVLNLSVGGCMIETSAPVHVDDIYHLELFVAKDQPPIELAAIARSVIGRRVGLKFLPSAREDQRLLAFLRARARADAELQPV
jgi:PilZ domain-containing protein